jgi:hypothetical protein
MFITVVADYGVGDLAFLEVRQRLAKLLPQATVAELPVRPFDTVGAGFCVAQLALGDGPAGRIVYANVAPRQDEADARTDNAGEPLAACRVPTNGNGNGSRGSNRGNGDGGDRGNGDGDRSNRDGVLVVGVASGHTMSFLAAAGHLIRAVKVADAGSQFRSRDVFPAAVAALAHGDDLLGAELTVPPPPERAVVWTDGYGNLKTSWHEPPAAVGSTVQVRIGDVTAPAVVSDGVFAVPAGRMSFAPGSSGWGEPFYELLLRGGDAAALFRRPPNGTPVVVT